MKKFLLAALIVLPFVVMTSCTSDDNNNSSVETSRTYQLASVADPGISGTAKVIKNSDNSITLELQLVGTPAGGQHPAHIHANTAAEGGGIAVTLGTVDGDTGFSTVTFSALDDTTTITYEELLNFDGYINVHLSDTALGTLVAQGDIGQNELTGTNKSFALNSVADPAISGTALFAERANGEALAIIQLANTPAGGSHPGHIHLNTAAESGGIAFTFNPVDGDTGLSLTNVSALDDTTAFGYSDVLTFDGYINIHLSDTALGTIVAQGDIGINELTGTSVVYPLDEVNLSGISGNATFSERVSGETLVLLELTGTINGINHVTHIHDGSVAVPGGIAVTLTNVEGDSGKSLTSVSVKDDDIAVTYAELIAYNGYINIHTSTTDLTVAAQGNIGSNVP